MKIAELEIKGNDVKNQLIQFIEKMHSGGYTVSTDNSYIYFFEDWSGRNNSSYTLNFVIIGSDDTSSIKLHIVGGGSGTGIFNIDLGKTSNEIKHFYTELVKVGKNNNFEVSELNIVKKTL